MNNKNQRLYMYEIVKAMTPDTASRHSVLQAMDISSVLETIGALNGAKAKVSKIRIHLRIYYTGMFGIVPIVVQTAGAISDDDNIAALTIDEILDDQIDDVFGYQIIQPYGMSKRMPTDDPTANTGNIYGREFTIEIPSNILVILNKETETERLQNLFLVLVGYFHTTGTVLVRGTGTIEFSIVRKKIVLR